MQLKEELKTNKRKRVSFSGRDAVTKVQAAIIAIIIVIAFVIGVYYATLPTTPIRKQEIHMDCSDWETLDPAYLTLQEESVIAQNIYGSLVRYKYGTVEIEGDLAESWNISSDGKVYTFHLRKGVKWQKGYGEFTAEDVKYSFDRIMDPKTQAVLRKYFDPIEEVIVLDKYEVQIKLKYPFAPFIHYLVGYKNAFIVNKNAIEHFGDKYGMNPVGTGPFEWVSGFPCGDIHLKAFEDYYMGSPRLKDVYFHHIAEESVVAMAFESGQLDIADISDPEIIKRYLQNPEIQVQKLPGLNANYIVINVKEKPFDDLRVRMALAYAIDKEKLLKTVLNDTADDLTNFLPKSAWGFDPTIPAYEHNPEKAKQLLAEAGYPNGFDTILYTYIGGAAVPACVAIQAMWKEVGINVELKALEIAQWADVVTSGKAPLAFMRITRQPDPDLFGYVMLYSKNDPQWNFGHYNNTEADRLLDLGRTTIDPEQRLKIYSDLQRIIYDDCPCVWLFSDLCTAVYHSYVKGYKLDPLWSFYFYYVYLE